MVQHTAVADRDPEARIVIVRGQRVILDSTLAALYGVSTGRFNEAIKRNAGRFPADFSFRISDMEYASLMSQSGSQDPDLVLSDKSMTWCGKSCGAKLVPQVIAPV